MQRALLGLAIAVILVLATALAAPLFVDWGDYREQFEAIAGRLVGLEVRVSGPIDVRILPAAVVTLQQITVGRPGERNPTHARALRIELALPALVSGELRAAEVALEGPDLGLNLDRSGRIDWSAPAINFDPEAVSIDHLAIEDGRVTLTDAANGTRLVLDKLDFTGQVGSLRGPLKGEGALTLNGRRYPYALTTSRAAADGTVKLRLSLDPADKSRTAELNASVTLERGVPKFDGTLQWVHAGGRGAESTDTRPPAAGEPWRVSAHIHADSTAAELDQIELLYGPDDRALRLRGDAELSFGAEPRLEAKLSASELDLDRVLALPDAAARRPLVAIRSIAADFAGTQPPAIPVRLRIDVDTVTLAGASLQQVGMELTADGEGWTVASLSLRGPGLTQFGFTGRLRVVANAVALAGKTEIDSTDPPVLVAWLANHGGVQLASSGRLQIAGDVTVDENRIAVDELTAELDRSAINGRLDYAWPTADRPARLDADLHAPQLDLDRVQGLLTAGWAAGAGELPLAWPHVGALAIDVERGTVAGIEAKDIKAKLDVDTGALDIEQLAIGDIGGAQLGIGGRIDNIGDASAGAPRGELNLDLDARSLNGVAALVEKFSAADADRLRRMATRAVPAKLSMSLTAESSPAGGSATRTTFKIGGSAGLFRVDMHGNVDQDGGALLHRLVGGLMASSEKSSSVQPVKLGGNLSLAGGIDAGDGSALVELLGLDRVVAVDKRGGRIAIDAHGPLDGDLAVSGRVMAGGLDLRGDGTLRLAGTDGRPAAQMALNVHAADVAALRLVPAVRPAPPIAADLTAQLALLGQGIALEHIDGTLAGTGIKGRLAVDLTQAPRLDGDLNIGAVDVPAVMAAVIGIAPSGQSDTAWSAEPFDEGFFGRGWAAGLGGTVKIHAARAVLTPKLASGDVSASMNFAPARLVIADIDGDLAGGRISGDLAFERGPDGLTVRSHLGVVGAAATDLLTVDGRAPVSGRLTADLDVKGGGRSPVALVGSLEGSGTLALQDGGFVRLDPAAFDTITRAVDRGLATDAIRVGDRMEAALSSAALPIVRARGTIALDAGQLTLAAMTVEAKSADLAVAGAVDLVDRAVNARLMLSAPAVGDPQARPPPVTITLDGPIDAPRRRLDVDELARWLTLRAVDLKDKRLDVLQAARDPQSQPVDSIGSATTEPAVAAPRPPRSSASPSPPRQRAVTVQPPALIGAAGDKSSDDQPRPRRPSAVQPLPPPIDIRPGPERSR